MDKAIERQAICADIIAQARADILANLEFLGSAVFRLKPMAAEWPLATDGACLYYAPDWVLKRYRAEANCLNHDYMHALLHCIFRHPFVSDRTDPALWDIACDIAVEGVILELALACLASDRDGSRSAVVAELRKAVRPLTAEKLYRHFETHPPRGEWRGLFQADVHDLWYAPAPAALPAALDAPKGARGSGFSAGSTAAAAGDPDGGHDPRDVFAPGGQASAASHFAQASPTRLREEWRKIGEGIQMALEAFHRRRGNAPGSLIQQLEALNRERCDYAAFLKRFAVRGEILHVSDSEFDPIFYTYGLGLYGNLPLIEPLESRETRRVREFVIAIDTSGSTAGELVRRFLTKTWDILMSTESFFSRVNIHILQCDAAVQEAVKLTRREDFEAYLRTMKIRGLGGTDFRPAFAYVDRQIRENAFRHLGGMLYFTDGYGRFPEAMPAYRTAFVFLRNADNNPKVPPWAIRLMLDPEEL